MKSSSKVDLKVNRYFFCTYVNNQEKFNNMTYFANKLVLLLLLNMGIIVKRKIIFL